MEKDEKLKGLYSPKASQIEGSSQEVESHSYSHPISSYLKPTGNSKKRQQAERKNSQVQHHHITIK